MSLSSYEQFTHVAFFLGPPGVKGHKGIMGRYGKVGPSGMKGAIRSRDVLSAHFFRNASIVCLVCFYD